MMSLWFLFFSAFISSTLFPGGSEAVLAYLVSESEHPLAVLVFVATMGNTLGAMTSWLIGRLISIRYSAEKLTKVFLCLLEMNAGWLKRSGANEDDTGTS